MKFTQTQFETLYDKVYNGQKPSFEEFLILLVGHGEIEFRYKLTKYGVIRLNDGYAIYVWNRPETEQKYKTFEDFVQNANINAQLIKDIWTTVTDVNFAD